MTAPLDDNNNPLINPPALPQGVPALDVVKTEHFMPAVEYAIAKAKEEIAAIRNNPAAPTFQNTIEALEFSGTELGRVIAVFGNVSGANSNDALRAIEEDFEAKIVSHSNDVAMDE